LGREEEGSFPKSVIEFRIYNMLILPDLGRVAEPSMVFRGGRLRVVRGIACRQDAQHQRDINALVNCVGT